MKKIAEAVAHARKSLELEGFEFTPEELAMQEKVAKGELTSADILRYADERVNLMRKEHPEFFAGG
jgi:hypothetical protein